MDTIIYSHQSIKSAGIKKDVFAFSERDKLTEAKNTIALLQEELSQARKRSLQILLSLKSFLASNPADKIPRGDFHKLIQGIQATPPYKDIK